MKTIDYKQPDFYHFSRDSIDLAEFASIYWVKVEEQHFFDYFSGCGVVGIEFALRLQKPVRLTFIEREKSFESYLIKNIKAAGLKNSCEIIVEDVSRVGQLPKNSFVLANPPYFQEGHGRSSPVKEKNSANFMSMQNWEFWIDSMKNNNVLFLGREDSELIRKFSQIKKLKLLGNQTAIFTLNRN